MTYRVPLAAYSYGEEERQAVDEVMRSGRVKMGARVEQFEAMVASDYGIADAVLVNSGSSANLLALSELGLPPGSDVIVPAVTWPTQVWPVIQLGMTPVLADVDPMTLAIRPDASVKGRAVWVAHLLGNPAPVDEIVAAWPNATLIEDCCEALDAFHGDGRVGTFGAFGTLSFAFNHHISTIEGGMVLCRSRRSAGWIRAMRSHGLTRLADAGVRTFHEANQPEIDPRFLFCSVGYNMHPTEITAALGMVQWRKRIAWADRRLKISRHWQEAVGDGEFIPFRFAAGSVPFAFPLILRADARRSRADAATALESAGIETRPIVAGNLIRQPAMAGVNHRIGNRLTGADLIHERGLYIGIHPMLTDTDVEFVGGMIRALARNAVAA